MIKRVSALISAHRRRLARVLFGLGLLAVGYQLIPNVPRETELEFELGAGHARVVELRVGFVRDGEEMHGVSLGFPEGAPSVVRRSFRLPSGEYELHCEIRERGGASHHSTHTVVTPADGVVQVSLIEHALREQPVMKLASGAAVARAQ